MDMKSLLISTGDRELTFEYFHFDQKREPSDTPTNSHDRSGAWLLHGNNGKVLLITPIRSKPDIDRRIREYGKKTDALFVQPHPWETDTALSISGKKESIIDASGEGHGHGEAGPFERFITRCMASTRVIHSERARIAISSNDTFNGVKYANMAVYCNQSLAPDEVKSILKKIPFNHVLHINQGSSRQFMQDHGEYFNQNTSDISS